METTAAEERKRQELSDYVNAVKGREYSESHLIAVLHRAQEIYRYLRKDVVKDVADMMGLSYSAVWGVATFYHYFDLEPRGDNVISFCLGTGCYVKGIQRIIDEISRKLDAGIGETTSDMRFTLQTSRCLGTCALAPVMMINGKIYGQLTAKKAVSIIERLKDGD